MEINIYQEALQCNQSDEYHAAEIINICQQLKHKKPSTLRQIKYNFS